MTPRVSYATPTRLLGIFAVVLPGLTLQQRQGIVADACRVTDKADAPYLLVPRIRPSHV